MSDYLEIARRHLRRPSKAEPIGDLKGAAVLFVADSGEDLRCWIVADDEDAEALRQSGIEPGDVVMDRNEARALVAVDDPAIVAEILTLKRELPEGKLHRENRR